MARTLHEVAASVVLALAIWLSSGTLAPYAQLAPPVATSPCYYLLNIDHEKNLGGTLLLEGAERARWAASPVLRRILYPLLAYPFLRVGGHLVGGVVFNIVMTIAAMIAFGRFIEARYGPSAAIAVTWLLATYPGITYWAGLPYPYAAIVPVSLLSAMLLYRMDSATRTREVALLAILLGILMLAYDLAPFFAPAAMFVCARRKKWMWVVLVAVLMVIPSIIAATLLSRTAGVSLMNENTQGYVKVLMAYRHPGIRHPGIGAWLAYLVQLPSVFAANYFFSNFLFLPLLAMIAVILARRASIGRVEAAILLAIFTVFLFNNAAPPYYGWQLRGAWIARLYQPVFVALLLCVARAISVKGRLVMAAVTVTVVVNATIAFGPIMNNPLAFALDHRFYRHSPPQTFAENLTIYGRRPLGICGTPLLQDPRKPQLAVEPFAYRPEPSR